jgi:membrane-bound lytic murein transglycosylase D
LMIPVAPTTLLAARTDRPVPVTASHPLAAPADLVAQAPASSSPDRVKLTYSVRPGDTLSSIAQVFRTTVTSLKLWNHLPGSRINAGDRLTIYASRADGPHP